MKWWLKKLFFRIKLTAEESYQSEAESLIIWYAVAYAIGVAFYLALPWEMPIWLVITYFEIILLLLFLYRNAREKFKFLTYVMIAMMGTCMAKANAQYTASQIEQNIPEISYLHGFVQNIDNYDNHIRLTLAHTHNFEKDLKGKFKISTYQKLPDLKIRMCVEMIAKFPSQYEPDPLGTYNTKRTRFYQKISAAGYAVSPIFISECETQQLEEKSFTEDIRKNYVKAIDKYATSDTAPIIKALIIGDKSNISDKLINNYRLSGLAHVLAISGLHMGMLALLVFLIIQLFLSPLGAGRYDWRKLSAVISLLCAYGYLQISGQSVSCQRAFIMTALVLFAVLINRRPISLRLWAFALLVIVCIAPETVLSPGFLMSFSATLGLISYYEKNADKLHKWHASKTWPGKIVVYFTGIIITDFIASLMTLPFSLYYFHQLSVYTTLANMMATPLLAFWIMPSLLLFLILGQTSFAVYALKPLSLGISLLNDIATHIATLSGAEVGTNISPMPEWSLLIITIGLLWLCIWEAKWRLWGLILIIIGFIGYIFSPDIDFVFDAKGETFACRTTDGKLSITPWHKNKFLTRLWTGSVLHDKIEYNKEGLVCTKEKCICQNDIEFSKGEITYKKQKLELGKGGIISLKKGIKYTPQIPQRIWHNK